jgi:phage tail tape-measure protein
MTADITEFNRKTLRSYEGDESTADDRNRTGVISAGGAAAGAAAGTAIGMTIGSSIPVLGTLIGAGVGMLAGAMGGMIGNALINKSETEEEKQIIQTLSKEYAIKGAAALTDENIKKLAGSNTSLADELIRNRSEVVKLC